MTLRSVLQLAPQREQDQKGPKGQDLEFQEQGRGQKPLELAPRAWVASVR